MTPNESADEALKAGVLRRVPGEPGVGICVVIEGVDEKGGAGAPSKGLVPEEKATEPWLGDERNDNVEGGAVCEPNVFVEGDEPNAVAPNAFVEGDEPNAVPPNVFVDGDEPNAVPPNVFVEVDEPK